MEIKIDNKHNLGETAHFFENEIKKNVFGHPEVLTTECESEIQEIIISVKKNETTWKYVMKDGATRTDNTIIIKQSC